MDDVRRRLRELGATDAQIDEALVQGNLGLASDVRLLRGATLSARQLAERSGTTLDDVIESYRYLGITVSDPDEVLFRAGEVALVELLRVAVTEVFTDDEGSDILRVTAGAFAQIADTAVNEFAVGVEGRLRAERSDLEIVEAMVATADLGEAFANVTGYILTHHFRQATQRQRASMGASAVDDLSRYAVGFVDLAGFTLRTAALGPSQLSEFVRHFEVVAFELAADLGARIVKHIGDEVMFASIDASRAAMLATELIRHFRADDVAARGGLAYGDVLHRRGDFHGPVVNLASRLTAEAVEGEVLVDAGMRDAAGERLDLEPAGRRNLKGFTDPVRVWSLQP